MNLHSGALGSGVDCGVAEFMDSCLEAVIQNLLNSHCFIMEKRIKTPDKKEKHTSVLLRHYCNISYCLHSELITVILIFASLPARVALYFHISAIVTGFPESLCDCTHPFISC